MSEQVTQPQASIWDQMDENATKSEGAGLRTNFGQLTVSVDKYLQWVKDQFLPNEITSEVYNTLPNNEKSMEILFEINVSEFNPKLEWTYSRSVSFSSEDWREIVLPSLRKATGKPMKGEGSYGAVLHDLNGKYVEANDPDQIKNAKYQTFELVKIFANKDECFAAWTERFGGNEGAQTQASTTPEVGASVPPGWTETDWVNNHADIKAAIAGGKSLPEVATDYGVEVTFIAKVNSLP